MNCVLFLGSFAKLRKANISFVMSVLPSVRPSVLLPASNNSDPNGRIFMKCYIGVFFEKPSIK